LLAGWSIVTLSAYSNLIPALAKFPLDHIGSLINALIIAYIISKFRLIDSKLVLQTVVLYLSLTIFLIAVYMRLMLFIIASLPVMGGYLVLLPSAGFAILVALLFNPLRNLLQQWIDRVLYSTASGPRRMLLNFNSKMGNIIELDQLADAILPAISKTLHITQAKLLFEDTNTGEFVAQFTYPEMKDKSNNEFRFNLDNPMVIWLRKETGPLNLNDIDNIPQLKGLWQSEKRKLIDSNIEFLYPIKSRGKKLIGILALGKKRSGALYSHGDIALVMSIVGQTGTLMENARLYHQAVIWAHTDGLTKLHNHRYFHERLSEEIARGSRSGAVFSVTMMDIDNFKLYNDTYGHLAGDKILRNLGEILLDSIRGVDMAFRYGGEEFAIILPGTQLDDAYKVTERIRKLIAEKTKSDKGSITVSLGISSWPNDGLEKEEVIARADAALYQAKRTGGNRTCTSAEIPHVSVEHETGSKALSIAYALAATADAKDHRTYGHSRKVSQYATAICEALGLAQDRIASIRAAALLHDIGKISIPDIILNKAGPLTPKESEPMKAHPWLGVEILKHVVDLDNCLPAILHHHEHYDGNGYPSGLKGETIPLESRILSIADAYDAMTSLRSYRGQLSSEEALDELRRCSGTQFDPELVNVFCKTMEQTLPKEPQTT
ncbi:MAG: diguanylate cyclase, partial [Chloroflexota bacterium]